MPTPKTIRCHEQAAALRADLGERCARCSLPFDLEFDCIQPNGPAHHGKSFCDRIRFYVREHQRGNLQLLCVKCHQLKSVQDKFNLKEAVKDADAFTREPGVRPITNRGPEPSVSDWAAWCRWHRGEPPLPQP